MNALCYKVIFSKRLGALVAVGENATSQGKSASGAACRTVVAPTAIGTSSTYSNYVGALKSLFVASTLACVTACPSWAAPDANALPTNGVVQTGAATVSTNGAAMTINQSTQKASINWNSFSIGKDASVNVVQNNASSVLLNRVVGNDPSQIFGKLTANGQVILINPNGIVFGKGGSVTASAFTASTFGMTEEDFKSGMHKYSRNGSTAGVTVENGANIHITTPGGYVALLGASVNNQGEIHTQQGAVVMASGESVALPTALTDSVGVPLSSKVRLELAPSTLNASVENSGTITTEGGQVLMQAAAVVDAVSQVANANVVNTGSIDTTGTQGGAVTVLADNGVIKVDGSIKANSTIETNKGGDIVIGRDMDTGVLAQTTDVSGAQLESRKGFVETSGHDLKIDSASVKAYNWLLDPDNIEITNGTARTGYSAISATTLANALTNDTNLTVNTTAGNTYNSAVNNFGTGHILVTDAVQKASGTGTATLNLIADDTITINNGIGATNGKLNLNLQAKNGINSNSAGTIDTNGGALTLNSNGTGTMAGVISGTGSLTKKGTGSITLSGANTYTGNTNVNEGTLKVSDMANFRSAGLNIATGSTFEAHVASNARPVLSTRSGVTVTGGGTFKKTGTGALNLRNNDFGYYFNMDDTGLVDVSQGSLQVDGSGSGQFAFVSTNKAVLNVADGATFDIRSQQVYVGGLTGAGKIINSYQNANSTYNTIVINVGASKNHDFSGVIGGNYLSSTLFSSSQNNATNSYPINLTKTGTGKQTLTGANTYSGTTTISAGTLQVEGAGTLGTSNITNNANLVFNDITGSSATKDTYNNNALLVSGSITSGTGSTVQKTGTGSVILSGQQSKSSGTPGADYTISGGVLELRHTASQGGQRNLDIKSLTVQNATVAVTAPSNGNHYWLTTSINLNGNAVLDSGSNNNIVLPGITITTNDTRNEIKGASGYNTGGPISTNFFKTAVRSELLVSGLLWNLGNVVKDGAGTMTMTGDTYYGVMKDNYTGTTINAGTLQIGNGGSTGKLGNGNVILGQDASLVFNRNNSYTVANSITGVGSVTQQGSGTTILTNANLNYSGATNVNKGTLQFGNWTVGAVTNIQPTLTSAINMTGGTLKFQNGQAITVDRTISGYGNVQTDQGLTLSGNVTAKGINESNNSLNISALQGDLNIGSANGADTFAVDSRTTGTALYALANNGNLKLNKDITVSNTGTSTVVLGAGTGSAENVSTGLVVTTGGGKVKNSAGTTRIYTGSASGTSDITTLVDGFGGDLRLSDFTSNGTTLYQNAWSNTVYSSNSGSTEKTQVYFREKLSFSDEALNTGTITYGSDSAANIKATLKQQNTSDISFNQFNNSNSKFRIAQTALIDNLSDASINSAVSSSNSISTSGHLNATTENNTQSLNNLTATDYSVTVTASVKVTPKAIIASGITANDKTYNQSNTASLNLNGAVLTSGAEAADDKKVYAGDTVNLSTTNAKGTFTSANVARDANGNVTTQAVTVTGLSVDNGNYTVSDASGASAKIEPKPLTALYAANNKVFDGNTNAVVAATLKDVLNGDKVSATHTSATFDTAEVGTNKTVTISGIQLTGADASNYVLANSGATAANTATAKANITAVPPKPPVPVVPTDGNSRVKVPVGSANPFALASAEDLGDDTCSANSIENCHCEESAVSQGVTICYEPKAGAKGYAR